MPNYNLKEVSLLDIQLVATALYVVSLLISFLLTFNDKQEKLYGDPFLSEKQSRFLSIFNRVFVICLTLAYLYINIENKEIAKEKKKDTTLFDLQVDASYLSLLGAIIVLYVVLNTSENNYPIPSIENPGL